MGGAEKFMTLFEQGYNLPCICQAKGGFKAIEPAANDTNGDRSRMVRSKRH